MDYVKNLVSIMIPTYNRPKLFEQTLASALVQDYAAIEILVCDNSTNDDTEKLVQKYLGDSRLVYRRNRTAKTKEENFAFFEEMAHGEYLQWLMDDDLIVSDKISKAVDVFETHPNVTLVTSQRGVIDENDNLINQIKWSLPIKSPYSIYPGEFISWITLREMVNIIGEPSAYLFRGKDLTHHYWRAESKGLKTISDIAMAIELLEHGDIAIFNEPSSFYRRHAGQEGQKADVILLSRIEWILLNKEYLARQVFPYTDADYRRCLQKIVEGFSSLHEYKKFASKEMWARYMGFVEEAQRVVGN